MPGSYTIRPIEATLTYGTGLFGKMDPYCTFQIGDDIVKSEVCKKGGKHPQWNEAVTIPAPITSEPTELMVHVMDKETFTSDANIGSVSINLRELQSQGRINRWFPLTYNDKPAGELLLEASYEGNNFSTLIHDEKPVGKLLLETSYEGSNLSTIAEKTDIISEKFIREQPILEIESANTKLYHEQRQVIEPHTFIKEVDVVETVSVIQNIEVLEPVKVMKEVEYTEVVPVTKQIETIEPQVVKKMIEVIEPRLVTKTIQVVENVPVMKEVEVIESIPVIKEVETFEPQTFKKQVEVTEYVPVTKQVEVTKPVHVKKAVEFVEDVITTQTITKAIKEPVIVSEEIKTSVGPATMVHVDSAITKTYISDKYILQKEVVFDNKL